jgi:Spy/CpxP family protein refolding chaperone
MMHRQSFLALALAAGLFAAPAAAQSGTPGAPPADTGRRMMKDPVTRLLERREQLQLTNDQARRLEQIRTKYQQKHQGHMEQMRRDREARSAFRASMDSARAEVAAVLTPAQQKQVEAMREEWRREWRAEHGGRHRHGGEHGRHHDDDDDDDDDDRKDG